MCAKGKSVPLQHMCCSGTLLPLAKAYKAWVGRIFLRCGSKSQKLLMLLEGTKLCESFGPRADKLLAGWKNLPPQKGAFECSAHQGYCPLWVAVFEICSNRTDLLPWKARLYHYNSCVVVVHSCLQLRLIRHEWGASFFDVGASLKNCSCRLKEQSCAGPSALEQTNCLRVGKIFPHKKALLSAVPIKGIVRFGWQFLRFAPIAWVCYPERHVSITTTHVL